MKNYLEIKVPNDTAFKIPTDSSFIKLHQLSIVCGRRGSGKTTFVTNILRMMRENNALDKVIIISSTFESNKNMFEKSLPLHDEIIDPNDENAIQKFRGIIDEQRDLVDEYHSKMKRWK